MKIKRKINGVGEKQDALFNILLDGPEDIIKKFNNLIAEYENKV